MKKFLTALLASAGGSSAGDLAASKPSKAFWHHHIQTRLHIDATPAQVWSVLMDFDRYPQWNPFIRELAGEAVVAHRLRVRVHPPGRRSMAFEPQVLQVDPAEEFRWRGRLFMPGLFDGEHYFLLQPHAQGGTWLVHGEHFSGLLVPLFRNQLDAGTRPGFEAMNAALREQARTLAVSVKEQP